MFCLCAFREAIAYRALKTWCTWMHIEVTNYLIVSRYPCLQIRMKLRFWCIRLSSFILQNPTGKTFSAAIRTRYPTCSAWRYLHFNQVFEPKWLYRTVFWWLWFAWFCVDAQSITHSGHDIRGVHHPCIRKQWVYECVFSILTRRG